MKTIKLFGIVVMILASLVGYAAPECDIDISVADITKGNVVPSGVGKRLEGKLVQAMERAGLSSANYDSRFFVAGRFDDAFKDITSGPTPTVYVKTTLTLYIGDADSETVYSAESFEISGVGSTEQQAYIRALNKISGNNSQLIDFLEKGKQKIIDYFDANYQKYINDAKKALVARNYDEALYYATLIPSCSRGYTAATQLTQNIMKDNVNYTSQQLLAKAKAAWATSPDAIGAEEAHRYLSQIDPASSSMPEAAALSKKISDTTQRQWEFENITKYKDELALEKQRISNNAVLNQQRIAAARDIAVAYAKSRPKQVNRYVFVNNTHHHYHLW